MYEIFGKAKHDAEEGSRIAMYKQIVKEYKLAIKYWIVAFLILLALYSYHIIVHHLL